MTISLAVMSLNRPFYEFEFHESISFCLVFSERGWVADMLRWVLNLCGMVVKSHWIQVLWQSIESDRFDL